MLGIICLTISSSDSIPNALNSTQRGMDFLTKGRLTCRDSVFLIMAKLVPRICLVSGDKQDIIASVVI